MKPFVMNANNSKVVKGRVFSILTLLLPRVRSRRTVLLYLPLQWFVRQAEGGRDLENLLHGLKPYSPLWSDWIEVLRV